MRRVEVILTCDACMAWKEREVTDGVVTVNASAGQTLDLCPDHVLALSRVWGLVAEWGATPEATRPRTRRAPEVTTPKAVPEAAPETAPDGPRNRRGGKRARARRANAVAASTAPPGSFACPLCDATPPNTRALNSHLRHAHHRTTAEVYGLVCPVCGQDCAEARGFGVHAKAAHHVEGIPGAFAMATAEGDPHGVIASRAEVLSKAANA